MLILSLGPLEIEESSRCCELGSFGGLFGNMCWGVGLPSSGKLAESRDMRL